MWDVVPRGSEDLNVSELLLENIFGRFKCNWICRNVFELS